MDEARECWEKELVTEIKNLSLMKDGSEEKARQISAVNQMYKSHIDDIRSDSEVKDKKIGYILNGLGIGLPIAASFLMFIIGIRFEEEGTIRSDFVRKATNWIRPTR